MEQTGLPAGAQAVEWVSAACLGTDLRRLSWWQAALQLSDSQADAICDAYESMSSGLNDVYSEQKEMISSISQPRQHELLGEQVTPAFGLAPQNRGAPH